MSDRYGVCLYDGLASRLSASASFILSHISTMKGDALQTRTVNRYSRSQTSGVRANATRLERAWCHIGPLTGHAIWTRFPTQASCSDSTVWSALLIGGRLQRPLSRSTAMIGVCMYLQVLRTLDSILDVVHADGHGIHIRRPQPPV